MVPFLVQIRPVQKLQLLTLRGAVYIGLLNVLKVNNSVFKFITGVDTSKSLYINFTIVNTDIMNCVFDSILVSLFGGGVFFAFD